MLNHRKIAVLVIAAVTTCSIMTGCGKKNNSILSSELVEESSDFGQDKAAIGDLVETKTFEAKRIYPISNVITSNYNGLVLESIEVVAGQEVKKGDLLVSIRPITQEMLSEKEAVIAKNREDYNKAIASFQQSVQSFQELVNSSSGTQQKLYQVELNKVQYQKDWYIKDGKEDLDELQEELNRLKGLQGDLNIYAAYDGVIDKVSSIQSGTELVTTREILSMHSEDEILFEITKGAALRYGQKVIVETGSNEDIKQYKGTVISANNVKNDSFKTGEAIVHLDEKIPKDELSNVRIKASIAELHNVLVVKEYAVGIEKEKAYVSILDGDKIMKRRVQTGKSYGGYTWILQGVEEGQTVTIQ